MKIVFASTQEQEEKIKELIHCIYQEVFPVYFSDQHINLFKELQILHTSKSHFEYLGTLKDAFQAITSLQTIISILQSEDNLIDYSDLFAKNASILNEMGLFFPFDLEQFLEAKEEKREFFSVYTKAANELLI